MAGPVTNTATAVTNGLFTTQVDFGPNVFTGSSKWLEIAISTNGANSFTTLAPRQQLTPAPYAITAESFSGILTPSELPSFQPPYATIGGGTANVAADSYSTVSGGTENSISTINGSYSAIGGGYGNSINYVITSVSPFSYTSSSLCTIGGGDENTINGSYASTIGGGDGNTVNGDYSTVGGGGINSANAAYATVSGGSQNMPAVNIQRLAAVTSTGPAVISQRCPAVGATLPPEIFPLRLALKQPPAMKVHLSGLIARA